MKKLGFAVLLLTSLAVRGHGATDVYQVGRSSMTTVVVTVSTSVATQMDNPALYNRVSVDIQNIDTSANLWCLPTSSPAPATSAGIKVTPAAHYAANMRDTLVSPDRSFSNVAFHMYCVSDGAASTKAAVSQAY